MDSDKTSSRTGRRRRLPIPRGSTPFGRIVEHMAWLASGKGVGAVLSLFYIAIVTRTLGPADFGRFTLIVGASTAINLIVSFNVWQVIVKYGQPYVRDRDPAGLGRLVALCAAMDLTAAIAGCGIAAVATLGFGGALGLPDNLALQALGFAAVMMLTIRSTPTGILRLLNRFDAAAFSETMIPIMRMAGALVVLFAGPAIPAFLLAWAIAELSCAAAYWTFAIRAAREEVGALRPRGFPAMLREAKGLPGFMLVTNASSTLQAMAQQAPVLLSGAFSGPAAAGFYRLGNQLVQSVMKISTMASRSLYSELAHVHANYSRAELRALFRKAALITMGAGAVGALAILLIGKPILLAMSGPAYAEAFPLLAVLGVASAINLAGVGFEPLLLATDGARLSLTVRVITIAVLLSGLFILLPRQGAIGAAHAVLAAAIVNFLLMGLATWRQLRG